MEILVTAPFESRYLEKLSTDLGHVVKGPLEEEGLLSTQETLKIIQDVNPEVLVVELNQVSHEIIDQADKLEVIAVCRGGTSNVDVAAASQKKVIVINTPGRNAVAVAEWTIALMLNLARNFYNAVEVVKEKKWTNMLETFYQFEGHEITGRTLGLIGFGSIGRELAKRMTPWQMDILVHDPYVDKKVVEKFHVKFSTIEDLFENADYVIVAAAATEETKGMISQKYLELMKPTSFFVNIARSSLVDNEALWRILKKGHISGAAIDVHDAEPLPLNSPWFDLDNVLLTPHLGGATKDVILRHSRMVYEDLLIWKQGNRPKNVINPAVWETKG